MSFFHTVHSFVLRFELHNFLLKRLDNSGQRGNSALALSFEILEVSDFGFERFAIAIRIWILQELISKTIDLSIIRVDLSVKEVNLSDSEDVFLKISLGTEFLNFRSALVI